MSPIEWREKTTPISSHFGDIYFDVHNGFDESRYVFLEGNKLLERFKSERDLIQIGELGFGTGLNFFTTLKYFLDSNSTARLIFSSCEKFPLPPEDIKRAISTWPELSEVCEEFLKSYVRMPEGFLCFEMFGGRVRVQIYFGDVLDFLEKTRGHIDAWYFDGFSPKKNPEMWRDEIFEKIAQLSHSKTSFSTFSCTGFLRRKLIELGAKVEKFPGYGRKREMLKGEFISRPKLNSSFSERRIAIIGTGIAANQMARSLSKATSLKVFEKSDEPAAGASGNALAMVMPFFTGATRERSLYSIAAFCFQRARYLSSSYFHSSGVLQSYFPPKRGHQIKNALSLTTWPEELISAPDAHPISSKMEGIRIPRAGILEAKSLLSDFWKKLEKPIHFSTEIVSIHKSKGKISLIDQLGRTYEDFDRVIFCTSYGIIKSFPATAEKLKINRGQVVEVDPHYPTEQTLVFGKYLSPVIHQRQMAGGTYRHDGEPAGVRQDETEEIQRDLQTFFSRPFQVKEARSSLRCRTNTHWPLVDEIEEDVFVCLGFGSRGFSESALAAEILASEIEGRLLPTDPNIRSQMRLASIRSSKR